MHMGKHIVFGLVMLNLLSGTSFAVSPTEAKSVLESRYKITRFDFLGIMKESGSVFVVRKEGLKAGRSSAQFKPNVVVNGALTSVGGGAVPLGGGFDGKLKIGDRLYLYDIKTGDNYVELALFTVKGYVVTGGTRGATPLQASVRFHYDEGLAAVSSKRVSDDISAWFRIAGELLPAAGSETERETVATRIVQRGQTPEEVTAILGLPDSKILLGSKSIFVFRDIRIVFIDGKVADAY